MDSVTLIPMDEATWPKGLFIATFTATSSAETWHYITEC